jgi:hypothetical protein
VQRVLAAEQNGSMIENANAFNELKIVWEKCYRWFCRKLRASIDQLRKVVFHPNG